MMKLSKNVMDRIWNACGVVYLKSGVNPRCDFAWIDIDGVSFSCNQSPEDEFSDGDPNLLCIDDEKTIDIYIAQSGEFRAYARDDGYSEIEDEKYILEKIEEFLAILNK